MQICHAIILDVLAKINGARKTTGIYYIVTGKKASQSLFDSQWFKMEHYFGVLQSLKHEGFNTILDDLQQKNLIIEGKEDNYTLTAQGVHQLSNVLSEHPYLSRLKGLRYSGVEQKCWNVIALYIQAVSQDLNHEKRYLPIVRDWEITERVRRLFPRSDQQKSEVSKCLYQELHEILSVLDHLSAEIFVKKLTVYQRIGSTFIQLSRGYEISAIEALLRFKAVFHHLLTTVEASPKEYPILYSLIQIYIDTPPLTQSASKTYELLQNKRSLQEIMRIRNIKRSTIDDHLVEIASAVPQFSIQPFVTDEEQEKIITFYRETNENKLRPFKDAFPHLTYLQIRLVLAKEGGLNGTEKSS